MIKSKFRVGRTLEPLYTGGKAVVVDRIGELPFETDGYLVNAVEGAVTVLGIGSGQVERRIALTGGAGSEVTSFAVSPDGTWVSVAEQAAGMSGGGVVSVVALGGQQRASWRSASSGAVLAMAVDATSTLVALGAADGLVAVHQVTVGDAVRAHATHRLVGHRGPVAALAFHRLLLASADAGSSCAVRLWDLGAGGACLCVLESHAAVVRGLAFDHSGSRLASASRDKSINVWDIDHPGGVLVRSIPAHESLEALVVLRDSSVQAVRKALGSTVPPFSQFVACVAGESGSIKLYDLANGSLLYSTPRDPHSSAQISDLIYHESKHEIIAITTDHNFLFHDLAHSASPFKCTRQIVGYNEEIVDMQFISPSQSILAVASNTEQIKLMHLDSSACDILAGHQAPVVCLDVARNGCLLASGSKDRTVLVWQYSADDEHDGDLNVSSNGNGINGSFSLVGSCLGHTEAVGAVAFSRKALNSGGSAFLLSGSQDRTIKCWDLAPLDKKKTLVDQTQIKFKTLYTFQAHEKDINSIGVAPNDKIFATGSQDKTAKIWSAKDGALLGTCAGHRRGVWCVQFSPVDQVLATSSGDKAIKLWSVSDFSCLKTFEGHLNSVLKVSFLSLGMQIVSCGSDGLVKLWTVKSSECVGTFDNHDDKVWALAVNRDESIIVSGGADSKITLWNDYTAAEKEELDRENTLKIEREQDLQNFLKKSDYKNAILLSMELDKPMRLLSLFREIKKTNAHPTSVTGLHSVDKIVCALDKPQLAQLLGYIKDWNTHTKYAQIAQRLLNLILTGKSAAKLIVENGGKIKELVDSLAVYSERHYAHADEMLKKSYFISYTLDRMDDMIGGAGDVIE
ncbi:U3 small nucleolar RNA-associated protein 13 [Physocladia obscura]|uniref:U3 small nucleolar RNA-associated protein 13 n=1 Tax=Physocladia obscura TaxID=109957 RepID=A0AAD5X983_9FUNG|nr:U3 small nucleolar RNA-associated protein 13 [Physocladia obscura]